MIELSVPDICSPALSFAGDVLNTAIGLARLGVAAGFASALGDDPFSDAMLAMLAAERVDTSAILRLKGGLPGLYAIRTDELGERRFFYWREASAARRMLDDGGDAVIEARLAGSSHIYLSGITLAILTDTRRQRLLGMLDEARSAGAVILFDANYRAALWPDAAQARTAMSAALARATIALPTLEDETALFGERAAGAVAARLHGLGVREVVVKEGPRGCFVSAACMSCRVDVPTSLTPVDTSGAGDAFNAGYIAARLGGRDPAEAAMSGHRMAAITLAHAGAIPPRAAVHAAAVLA